KALVIEMPPEPNQPRALWAIFVDTGRRRQLTWPPAGKADDHQPAVSPDGKTLVFSRETGWRAAELYVMELMPGLSPAGAPGRALNSFHPPRARRMHGIPMTANGWPFPRRGPAIRKSGWRTPMDRNQFS